MSLAKRHISIKIAAKVSAYYSIAIVERLAVVVERLVVIVEYSYSPITLSSILTIGVALRSKRRANKVVEVPTREKAIVGVVAGAVSLL